MKLYKIETGKFLADGGAMFGVVPKKVWQKRYPANDDNYCLMHMRSLLVETENRLILVDTGVGTKQVEYLKYYNITDVINFERELNKLGYCCSDVTDVVLTHLHFDHCGDCTHYNADHSQVVLTFPNATYWVGKAQWENFLNPNVREGNSYFKENLVPVQQKGQLQLVEQDMQLAPNVRLKLYNGHTVGQIAPYFNMGNNTLVYVGDVIPMLAAVPIAWVSAYDTYPITSMEDKERLLAEAAENGQILFFEHDAYHECCTIKKVNERYRVDETFNLDTISGKLA